MTLINLTPHPVHLHADGIVRTYLPEPTPARLSEITEPAGLHIDGAPVVRVAYGAADLPPQSAGTTYIVSQMVAAACPDRDDLVYPYDIVRDSAGRIVGCRACAVCAA